MEIILLVILICVVVVLVFLQFYNKNSDKEGYLREDVRDLNKRIGELQEKLSDKMTENSDKTANSVQNQLKESQKLIADITQKMTKFEETNKNILTATDRLEDLQNILLNPKHRGNFGEFQLKSVLENFFAPNQWEAQYKFKNGEIVDAIIRLKDKQILPIDSKFSLENYNRMINEKNDAKKAELAKIVRNDIKMRVDETAKYIRPDEDTMDFAFMFIPSEALYYDMLIGRVGTGVNEKDLIEYATREKHVIIVSPTTFVAYLQTVLQGLRSFEIESQAKDIQKNVQKLSDHLAKYNEFMTKLGNSLGTTVNHFNAAGKEFKKVDKDIVKIAGGEEKLLIDSIEKPSVE